MNVLDAPRKVRPSDDCSCKMINGMIAGEDNVVLQIDKTKM